MIDTNKTDSKSIVDVLSDMKHVSTI